MLSLKDVQVFCNRFQGLERDSICNIICLIFIYLSILLFSISVFVFGKEH